MSLREKIDEFENSLNEHFSGDLSKKTINRILINFVWAKLLHGICAKDYILYDFYRYSNYARDEFVTTQRRKIIDEKFNTPEGDNLFKNKEQFCNRFSDFLNREWLNTITCEYEEFEAFVKHHPIFFIKNQDGSFGAGAGKINIQEYSDHKKLFQEFQESGIFMEELLQQNEELNEFNSTSVNTLRMVTVLRPNGEVKIVSAGLRLGREGKIADNFHNMGIAALIDIETGIVYTQGIDRSGKKYIVHPDSNKPIVGYQVPMWEKVISFVEELAHVVPEEHYVGWDIVVGEDKLYVIEGNGRADPDVTQMPDGIGKWPLYKPLIEEISAEK